MTYRLEPTRAFQRSLEKFLARHGPLGPRVNRILHDLAADPQQPHLRLHALHGARAGEHAASITHSYRILLVVDDERGVLTLLDIGSHDEVYR